MEHVDLAGLRRGLGLVPTLFARELGDIDVQLQDILLLRLDLFQELLQIRAVARGASKSGPGWTGRVGDLADQMCEGGAGGGWVGLGGEVHLVRSLETLLLRVERRVLDGQPRRLLRGL